MQAIHAVTEMASVQGRQYTVAVGRFRALVRMTMEMENPYALQGLRTALARLLYASASALGTVPSVRPGVTVSMPEPRSTVKELLVGQNLDVQRVLQMTADCRSLPDFIRAVGDGGGPPTDPTALGAAASVVLREVLTDHGAAADPMRRWIVLAKITNTVVAAHYLHGSAPRSSA